MFILVFFLLFVICNLKFEIFALAVIPPVIPDSVNTNQLFTGSFDPQYPNKEFVPNDPSGVICEFVVSEEQNIGTSNGIGITGTVTINKQYTNENTDLDGRVFNFSEYEKTQCSNSPDIENCIRQRNNSMDAQNNYGASSPVQRQLPQSEKNKLYCQRWHSGILSGAQIAETDERVGCYCGDDDYQVNKDCTGSCRDVYFSELAFFNTSYCPLPSDINKYYDCDSGSCPIKKREPQFTGLISKFVATRLLAESSIVPKGSAATRITQIDSGKTTLAALPFQMAPSSDNSTYAIKTVFPASSPPKTDHPSCSPVTKKAGPDEYYIDWFAQIVAFITGDQARGQTTMKQEFSEGTIEGHVAANAQNMQFVPQSQQDRIPPPQTQYTVTADPNNTILNPSTSVEYLRKNLSPASWQHL